jgi:hypothetical protein
MARWTFSLRSQLEYRYFGAQSDPVARLECQGVDNLIRGARIAPDLHSELTGEIPHGNIVREIHGIQSLHSVSPGVRDQSLHQ